RRKKKKKRDNYDKNTDVPRSTQQNSVHNPRCPISHHPPTPLAPLSLPPVNTHTTTLSAFFPHVKAIHKTNIPLDSQAGIIANKAERATADVKPSEAAHVPKASVTPAHTNYTMGNKIVPTIFRRDP
ncbi:MAG: hypothetical protein KAG66_07375, partial [Methylococcales bacterium]|nr:hypothetical protein [Methylococcales bacterium]